MSTCPGCGATTVTTPDGRHLNPAKSRLGRHLTDGTELTADEQRTAGVRGHFAHVCDPRPAINPTPEQHQLF